MRMRHRRFRVSVFGEEQKLWHAPLKRFASYSLDRYLFNVRRERRKLASGKCGYIVLHQGNLKRRSCKILDRIEKWSGSDELAFSLTAFPDFEALLTASGGYCLSVNVAGAKGLALAEAYDAAQAARGCSQRAFRYLETSGVVSSHENNPTCSTKRCAYHALSLKACAGGSIA